jgi:hypothetical protein
MMMILGLARLGGRARECQGGRHELELFGEGAEGVGRRVRLGEFGSATGMRSAMTLGLAPCARRQ